MSNKAILWRETTDIEMEKGEKRESEVGGVGYITLI
jgi:hypothetical protein